PLRMNPRAISSIHLGMQLMRDALSANPDLDGVFLRSATIPVVELMDVQGERLDMEVGFDNRQAAFDMVCTMLEKRVRHKILYLGSKDDTRDEQRYQGYCDAMMLHNLSPLRMNPRAISSIHLGMQLMRDALSANPDLDGVF
ncbi:hypothetical protein ACLXAY_24110, partial [Escherichia coli]